MAVIALAPTDPSTRTYGQLIRDARIEAGLTQSELAIASGGVERPAVSQWEGDRTLVAPVRQPLVEDALGLDPGTLGAWVRHSPLYLATLPDAPDEGAIPGLLRLVTPLADLAA